MSIRTALLLDGDGWAARAVVGSLGRAGWRVLAPAGTKSSRSRYCGGNVVLPDYRADVGQFVDVLARTLRETGAELVIPAEDATLELLYDTPGLLGGARVLGGDRRSARLALDKARTLERASAAGFGVPRWRQPEGVEAAVTFARELGFPGVIKPRRSYARAGPGMRSARLRFATDAEAVRRAVREFVERGFELPLVQEWVPGRSIGVAAVVSDGLVLAWGAREAFSQCPIRGGSAVWRATVGEQTPGVSDALRLLVDLGFEGLGDVQYHIAADGRPRLMEIGARTYGWLPLTIAAGADLPAVAARALDGELPAETIMARPGLQMRWPRGELARLAELLSPRVQLPPGARRRDVLRQLWPLWGRDVLYDGWNTGDRRPLLAG